MKKVLQFFLFVFLIALIFYLIYSQAEKTKIPGKLERLECHKNIICLEKVYSKDLVQKAKELLYTGNFTIDSDIEKSVYMPSTLFQYVSIEDTDQFFYNFIQNFTHKENNYQKDGLILKYVIYENDKQDPKKRSDKCKLYRGYIVFKVLSASKKLIYQTQIDFMDQEGKDIPQTLECALKSFLTCE